MAFAKKGPLLRISQLAPANQAGLIHVVKQQTQLPLLRRLLLPQHRAHQAHYAQNSVQLTAILELVLKSMVHKDVNAHPLTQEIDAKYRQEAQQPVCN
jgi:hypothetical protein